MLFATIVLCGIFVPGQKPKELEEALADREQFLTAHIEWATVGTDGRRTYQSSRLAGSDSYHVYHGDENGLLDREREGELFSYSDVRVLDLQGEQWQYTRGNLVASVVAAEAGSPRLPVANPRYFGFEFHVLADLPKEEPDDYATREVDGMLEILGSFREQEYKMRWVLDPSKGFAPISTTFIAEDGVPTLETRSEYEEVEGRWFPTRIEGYRNGARYRTVEVLYASFDAPEHPVRLGPELLDMPVNTNIMRSPSVREDGRPDHWDGERAIDSEEWTARYSELDTTEFFRLKKEIDAGRVGTTPRQVALGQVDAKRVGQHPRLWEEYVRGFILRERLSAVAARKVWEAHRDCYRSARAIQQQMERASGPTSASKEEFESVTNEQLEKIFVRTLVPQLDRIAKFDRR